VFGDGVNDEQTFSFLLQSAFPHDAVHLHALSGYSWASALVTMERIQDQIHPGDIVILGYAYYYKERHVEAPGRLRDIRDWMARSFPEVELSPKDRLVRARLDGANHLVLDTIPMHCKFNPDYCTGAEPTADYTDKVSMELLRSIAAKTSAKIYLIHFFGPRNDPVLGACGGRGFQSQGAHQAPQMGGGDHSGCAGPALRPAGHPERSPASSDVLFRSLANARGAAAGGLVIQPKGG